MKSATFSTSIESIKAEIKAANEHRIDEHMKSCLEEERPVEALGLCPVVMREALNAEGKRILSPVPVYPSRLVKALASTDIFSAVSVENAFSALYLVTVEYLQAAAGESSLSVSFGAVKKCFYKWVEKMDIDCNISPASIRLALHSILRVVKGKNGKHFDISAVTTSAVEKVFFAVICESGLEVTCKGLKRSPIEKAAEKAAAAAASQLEAYKNHYALMNERYLVAVAAEEKAATEEEKATATAELSKYKGYANEAAGKVSAAVCESYAAAAVVREKAETIAAAARKAAAEEVAAAEKAAAEKAAAEKAAAEKAAAEKAAAEKAAAEKVKPHKVTKK